MRKLSFVVMLVVAGLQSFLCSTPASAVKPNIMIPANAFMVLNSGDVVAATGTWIIPDAATPGGLIADPVNSVRIECVKSAKVCYEAIAIVTDGESPDKFHGLLANLNGYDVTTWTAQEVTAETAALCATTTLTINLLTEEVFRITRNGGLSPNGCKAMPSWKPFKKPAIEKLVTGLDALNADPRTR